MNSIVKPVAYVVGALLALLIAAYLIGTTFPIMRASDAEKTFPVAKSKLLDVVLDAAKLPQWRSDVRSVESVGTIAWTEITHHPVFGNQRLRFRIDLVSDDKLELSFAEDGQSAGYSGQWTFNFSCIEANITKLTLREATVTNDPLQRLITKYFSDAGRASQYLLELEQQLNKAKASP